LSHPPRVSLATTISELPFTKAGNSGAKLLPCLGFAKLSTTVYATVKSALPAPYCVQFILLFYIKHTKLRDVSIIFACQAEASWDFSIYFPPRLYDAKQVIFLPPSLFREFVPNMPSFWKHKAP